MGTMQGVVDEITTAAEARLGKIRSGALSS